MSSNVIHVDFRPTTPKVTRAVFDSATGEWTLTVARPTATLTPPVLEDLPRDIRRALFDFAAPIRPVV